MKKIYSLILLVLIFLLAACGNEAAKETVQEERKQESSSIHDLVGKEISLDSKPEAIVTLVPSITEIVFELGLGDNIVGRSEWCNYPEEAAQIPSVGGMEFDVETILGLKPDLIIAHEMGINAAQGGFEQLQKAGIPLLILQNETNFEDVYRNILLIGKVTHTEEEAEQLVNKMKEDFANIAARAETIPAENKRKVWVEIDPTLITAGKNTFIDEMLKLINAENLAKEKEGWPQFSEEQVISQNPDVIVRTYGYYIDVPIENVLNRQGWEDVTAIKEKRVYDIDNDMVTRAGPRLAKGVEELAKAVYPEIFAQ